MPWWGWLIIVGVVLAVALVLWLIFRRKKEPKVVPKDSFEAGQDAVGAVVKAGEDREKDRAEARKECEAGEVKAQKDTAEEKKKLTGEGEDEVAKWVDDL